jgi:hypothetical protein
VKARARARGDDLTADTNLLPKDGFMAGKPLNRLELRRQNDAAEPLDPMEDESEDLIDDGDEEEATERKTKKKPKAAAKPKAKSSKPVKPAARMRIVWVVTNDAFKPVGTFEYSQKEAADARAAELTAKGKGTHFVQKVKEPMPDNAPGLGASIPRPATPPPAAKQAAAAAVVEDEEETEDEEEADAEMEEESEEEE